MDVASGVAGVVDASTVGVLVGGTEVDVGVTVGGSEVGVAVTVGSIEVCVAVTVGISVFVGVGVGVEGTRAQPT